MATKAAKSPFHLRGALASVTAPGANPSTKLKRQYSDDLSRVFSHALEGDMGSHFPNTFSGNGTGTNAASASGIKSVDVAFNIEGLFLGLGLSVKVVGLPEKGQGYTHNFKRLTEEWTLEAVNYHRYMPYSVIVGMLFLPSDCMSDRKEVTSLGRATHQFGPHRGRDLPRDDHDNLEEIYIGVYEPSGSNAGDVFFISAERDLGDREVPAPAMRMTFEDVKDDLVVRFKKRNPKLKVTGMP